MTKNNEMTKVDFDEFYDKYDIKRYDRKLKELHKILNSITFYSTYNSLLEIVKDPDSYSPYIYDIYRGYIIELEISAKGLVPFLKDSEFIKVLYDQVDAVLSKAKEIVVR